MLLSSTMAKMSATEPNAPLAGYGASILYCRDTFAALVLITRRSDDWPARPDQIAQHNGSTDSGSDVDSWRQEI